MNPKLKLLIALDEARSLASVNCGNCTHADLEKSVCNLYSAQPPMKVVLEGCPSFEMDIPF